MSTNFPVVANVGTDLADALQNKSKVNETKDKSGVQYMRYYPNKGKWTYGKKAIDVTGGTMIVNTQSIMHGWHLWHEKKLVKESMVPFIQDLPVEPEPIEFRNKQGRPQTDYAAEARGLQAMMDTEEGDQILVEFAGTSYGIRQCIDTLLNEIRQKSFENKEFLYPEVELQVAEPYENPHKEGDMIYNPQFEVVGWYNVQGEPEGESVDALEDQSEDTEETEKAEEEVEKAEPKRRRRRKQ